MSAPETPPASTRSPARPPISLHQPSAHKGPAKSARLFRRFRSVFKSLPIMTPACKIPVLHSHHSNGRLHEGAHIHGGTRLTGTLFGHRKGRISLAIQENPKCLPMVLIELGIQTGKLLQDMGMGMVRIAMECEKQQQQQSSSTKKLMEEPVWSLFCNGRKTGYGVKREATEEDLSVMQVLCAVSMGAGVLPASEDDSEESAEGEMTYMRAYFERVVGSKDSETYYMMNPDGNSGPELSIFFVRI
uniref:Protein MIZU-KUSSEI 1 n=1 Tax=Kalanchoe fedtschenkoi TaxID=63787 RepID=A0A7N0ZSE0_KALFE